MSTGSCHPSLRPSLHPVVEEKGDPAALVREKPRSWWFWPNRFLQAQWQDSWQPPAFRWRDNTFSHLNVGSATQWLRQKINLFLHEWCIYSSLELPCAPPSCLSTELYHHLSNFLSSVSEGTVNAFRLQMTSFNREKEQLTGPKNVLCAVFMSSLRHDTKALRSSTPTSGFQ